MGACMRKPEKSNKNIKTDGSVNQDSSKKVENLPENVKKSEPVSTNSKSGQNISKKTTSKKKKSLPKKKKK